jgi:glycosyltransferase involved in cell wall biosynthesis
MTDLTRPKVSVITIVFNGEEFIESAIRSIASQTFADFEHVIVDDGSDDGTAEVLTEWSERDRRIKVVHQENSGIPRSYNRALEMAQGEYIAILDADDLAFPTRLEEQVSFLDGHRAVGLVGSAELAMEVTARRFWLVNHPVEDRDIRRSWVHQQVFTHSATMVRRQTLQEVGHYDENLPVGCDPDLWLRIIEKWKAANLPAPLVLRRYHAKQVSRTRRFNIVALNVRMKWMSIRKLKLPAYYYLYLIFPVLGVLPDRFKRLLRRRFGHQRHVLETDVEGFLNRLGDLL